MKNQVMKRSMNIRLIFQTLIKAVVKSYYKSRNIEVGNVFFNKIKNPLLNSEKTCANIYNKFSIVKR